MSAYNFSGVGEEPEVRKTIHIFSRHGVFNVVDGVREQSSGWYPVVYGKSANVFPDRTVHLWFCGEGSSGQLSEFNKDGEPIHHYIHGYDQRVRDFANNALWGCLREKMPNETQLALQRGFKKFLEFSIATAETITTELPADATLIFQDYQFLLMPGILNGTLTKSDIVKTIGEITPIEELAVILEKLEKIQERFSTRDHKVSTFLHTSLPQAEFWNELPDHVGSTIVRSMMSEPIGVHSLIWAQRLGQTNELYGGEDGHNIFVSPIGMDSENITEFLATQHAALIRKELEADNLGDRIVLISGRADPKNSISDVLTEVYNSFMVDPSLWNGVTLVLQVPPDKKEGCDIEFDNIVRMVDTLQRAGFGNLKWYNDNNRERSLVLAEKAEVFVSGSLLGGFEVVTLEALFANPKSKIVCSDGIGSAYVLDGLATRYSTHSELGNAFNTVLSNPFLVERGGEQLEHIESLRMELTPDAWLLHVVGEAEKVMTAPLADRQAFLERCFTLSGLQPGHVPTTVTITN